MTQGSIPLIGLDSSQPSAARVAFNQAAAAKSSVWCLYGDSIVAGGNAVFTGVTITGQGNRATVKGATLHGLNAGMPVFISNTLGSPGASTPAYETAFAGHFTVESSIDANSFTYLVDSDITLPGKIAGSSAQVLNPASLNDRNFAQIASAQLGNPFGQIINCGVSGQTAAYLLANIDALLLAKNPTRVSLLCGVNDITNDTSETGLFNTIVKIVDACNAAGAFVELYTMPPLGNTASGYTAARQATLIRVNDDLLDYYRTHNNGCQVIDAFSAVVDFSSATGNWISTYTADQKHPNALGALAIAGYIVTANTNSAPPSPKYARSFINRIQTDASSRQLQNGSVFTGSGGTASAGTIADTWTLSKTGTVTATGATLVARADGVGYDNTISCTGAVANDVVDLIGSSAHSFCSAGDYLSMEMHLRGSGLAAVSYIRAYIEIVADGNTYTIDAIRANGASNTLTANFDWTLRSPIGRIPTNAASITTVRTRLQVGFNGAAAGPVVFTVGRTTIHRFNGLI